MSVTLRRVAALSLSVAAVAVSLFVPGLANAQGGAPLSPQGGQAQRPLTPAEREARAIQYIKSQFGFSDAQAKKFIAEQKKIITVYKPKLDALETKYGKGKTLTPAQKQQAQKEMMPIVMELTKKTQDALLKIATPEQREKIQTMLKAQQPQSRPAGAG